MNAKLLAKILLSDQDYKELSRALNLLENKKLKEIYNCYSNMLSECLPICSYDDFYDFFSSDVLDESIFVFGFLWLKGECIQIGGYEQEVQLKINLFVKGKISDIDLENFQAIDIFTDYDGDDNFTEYISQLNGLVSRYNMRIVVLFNDIYCACAYDLFILDTQTAETIMRSWNDDSIKLCFVR